ncbi:hypothetical protein PoB_003171200 [Plakobranchus ocellatus]|uniref:Uncharacterized protein n=1 Tax=Plakobranchus ocellatus TaxID=259542 RepID=A0AAV4ADY0_9GAST|nr:hypothetical protein PoB_003171200 [Plakobranchus ocellatus]
MSDQWSLSEGHVRSSISKVCHEGRSEVQSMESACGARQISGVYLRGTLEVQLVKSATRAGQKFNQWGLPEGQVRNSINGVCLGGRSEV